MTAASRPLDGWMMFMRPLSITLGIVAALLGSAAAVAQTWPSRPITLVVPYSAGGPTDTIGRMLAERIQRSLGQPVVLDS